VSTRLTTLRAAPLHHLALAALVALGACGERVEPRTRHSVLLVTIDTLRADRLGCTGHATAQRPDSTRSRNRASSTRKPSRRLR
jgi:hypothetical protein